MNKIREWFQQFMVGRYGTDQLSIGLNIVVLALIVLALFAQSSILNWIAIALFIYNYFRVFSKNRTARYRENQKYLTATANIRARWKRFVNVNKQRKDFHIYTCPNKECRQKIRIPKGKGKIVVTCPKCKTQFTKKS